MENSKTTIKFCHLKVTDLLFFSLHKLKDKNKTGSNAQDGASHLNFLILLHLVCKSIFLMYTDLETKLIFQICVDVMLYIVFKLYRQLT